MTSFQAIRQCFAKLNSNDKRPVLKRPWELDRTLLLLTFAAFQCFSAASAAPVVTFTGHNTNRFGPHSFPGGIPVGDKVQVITAFNTSDPIGSPTISVEAIQGGTTLTLDRVPLGNPMFDPFHVYYKFIDFDPGLTGSWQITPTDSTGVGPSAFTPSIVEPEFLPLVEDIMVQGTPLGARVAWTVPNLDGFDANAIFVRIIDATSGGHLWESNGLPVQTTSFAPPAGVLQVGVDYVYSIILSDFEGSNVENSSWTFSEPFRFTALTVNGDFNLDGTIDAADYVFWRKNPGGIYLPDDYAVWRSHFGDTAGSGAALPSADPLSAAVPEPATLILMILAAAGVCSRRRRAA